VPGNLQQDWRAFANWHDQAGTFNPSQPPGAAVPSTLRASAPSFPEVPPEAPLFAPSVALPDEVVPAPPTHVVDDSRKTEEAALAHAMEQQMAQFLQGDGLNFDEESEGSDADELETHEQEASQTVSDVEETSPEGVLLIGSKTETFAVIADTDNTTHPCLDRGRSFAENFKNVELNLQSQEMRARADGIVACVEQLYKEKTRPALINVQRALFLKGFPKRVVQCVLGICARCPDLFDIWLEVDMQVCILLASHPLEAANLEDPQLYKGRYDTEFLQELASWVTVSAGSLNATANGMLAIDHHSQFPMPEKACMETLWKTAQVSNYGEAKTMMNPLGFADFDYQLSPIQVEEQPKENSRGTAEGTKTRASKFSKPGISTLMLRNIPKYMTSQRLEQEVVRSGFVDNYDFIYAPRNLNTNSSMGYAFINFLSGSVLQDFAHAWHGSRHLCQAGSDMPIDVSVAELQGLAANAKRWSSGRMMRLQNPALRPIIRYAQEDLLRLAGGTPQVDEKLEDEQPVEVHLALAVGMPVVEAQ